MKNYIIKIGSRSIEFEYKIKETIEIDNLVVILLEIPFSDSETNNVYAFEKSGKQLWRVDTKHVELGLKNLLPFEIIRYFEGKLYATDFYGRRFEIDLVTGKTVSLKILK